MLTVLQNALDDAEMSQADLARELDVTPGLVSQWINETRQVAGEQVLPICKALGFHRITPHQLRPDLYPLVASRALVAAAQESARA